MVTVPLEVSGCPSFFPHIRNALLLSSQKAEVFWEALLDVVPDEKKESFATAMMSYVPAFTENVTEEPGVLFDA